MDNQSSSMNTMHGTLVIVTEHVCPAFYKKCNKGLISQESYKVFPLVTKKIINMLWQTILNLSGLDGISEDMIEGMFDQLMWTLKKSWNSGYISED